MRAVANSARAVAAPGAVALVPTQRQCHGSHVTPCALPARKGQFEAKFGGVLEQPLPRRRARDAVADVAAAPGQRADAEIERIAGGVLAIARRARTLGALGGVGAALLRADLAAEDLALALDGAEARHAAQLALDRGDQVGGGEQLRHRRGGVAVHQARPPDPEIAGDRHQVGGVRLGIGQVAEHAAVGHRLDDPGRGTR